MYMSRFFFLFGREHTKWFQRRGASPNVTQHTHGGLYNSRIVTGEGGGSKSGGGNFSRAMTTTTAKGHVAASRSFRATQWEGDDRRVGVFRLLIGVRYAR